MVTQILMGMYAASVAFLVLALSFIQFIRGLGQKRPRIPSLDCRRAGGLWTAALPEFKAPKAMLG